MVRPVNTAEVTACDSGRLFLQWCDRLSIPPTQRQWCIWQRGEGQPLAAARKESGHNRKLRARLIAVGLMERAR